MFLLSKFNGMLLILVFLASLASANSAEKIGLLVDPYGSNYKIYATGIGEQLILSKTEDGGEIFKLHMPPVIGKTESIRKALNIESMKYPGYFVMATKDLKRVILEKPTDADSMQRATFRLNLKVRTKASILLLEGHEYEFVCNTKKPYKMVIKTDDNTRFFADRCSYSFKKLSKKEIKKRLNGEVPTSQVPGVNAPDGPNGAPEDGNKNGTYLKLYIPASPGLKPILGLKVNMSQKARIGMPPDQFIVKSPGLNGIEGSYSFESVKYPTFFLQRVGRDIYLERIKRNPDFYSSASFKTTPFINKKHRFFISPYAQPEWFLGHLHEPPFYVRAMFNNNTAEFDLDASWIFKYETKKDNFGFETHQELFKALMKFLALIHGPISSSQETALFQGLHGNSPATIDLLMTQHNQLLLSQLATINGLQGLKPSIPPASDPAVMSDATTAANSNAGANAASTSGTATAGAAGGSGTATSGAVTDNGAKQTGKEPEAEVVVEKYEPWSDWSSCSAQCGTGHQIRVRPCKVVAQDCTPLQQSQPCVAAAPCQPAAPVAAPSPPVSQPAPQVVQGASIIQGQPVQSGACPMTCSFDCNPASCPLRCCSHIVKKAHIERGKKSKRKLPLKKARKSKKHKQK